MPQGRPSIPREVAREVLFQARHRCAVCCEPTPLERAHIRPWSKSQDNSVKNLIALCANCHQRADNEKWGEDFLRRYKQEPCALQRDRLPPMSPVKKALVDLIIGIEPDSMTDRERHRLVSMLAAYLDLPTSAISVVSVLPANSVRVRLELPADAAERLCVAFETADALLTDFVEDFELVKVSASNGDTFLIHGVSLQTASKAPRLRLDLSPPADVIARLRILLGFTLGAVSLLAAAACIALGSAAAAIAIGTTGVIGALFALANAPGPGRFLEKALRSRMKSQRKRTNRKGDPSRLDR